MSRMRTALISLSAAILAIAASAVHAQARTWKPPTVVEHDDRGDASSPQVAFDPQGFATAVWTQSDGTRNRTWAARYSRLSGWTDGVMINGTNEASAPQVAMAANGNAIAVWVENAHILWRLYDAAAGDWGATVAQLDANTGDSSAPQVAFAPDNTAIAIWQQSNGTTTDIRWSRYSGGAWVRGAQPIDTAAGNATLPQVAFDTTGKAQAVWRQVDGTRGHILSARFASGSWGGPMTVDTMTGNADAPQVDFDGSGNAWIIWTQFDGTRSHVFGRRALASGVWDGVADIEANTGDASAPQLAVDASGNAIVVWYQLNLLTNFNDAWANHLASGGTWNPSAAELLEHSDNGDALYPSIALDAAGNGVAVWQQFDGSHIDTRANFYAGSWSGDVSIDTATGDVSLPRIAFDATGNGLAVWAQRGTTRIDIDSARFSNQKQWGQPAAVTTAAINSVQTPLLVFDASGNALATWTQAAGQVVQVWAGYYNATTHTWAHITQLDTSPTSGGTNPRVAFEANGNGLLVWQQFTNNHNAILARHYTPNVGWSGVETVNGNATAASATQLSLASNASGVTMVTWMQVDEATPTVKSVVSRRYAAAAWSGVATVGQTDGVIAPAVAIDASGSALVTWSTLQGSVRVLTWNRSGSGANTWSTPLAIPTNSGGSVGSIVRLATGANNTAMVMWRPASGSRFNTNFLTGSTWGAVQTPTGAVGGSVDGQFAFDSSGLALAVWSRDDTLELQYNRATATGTWGTPLSVTIPASAGFIPFGPRLAFGPNGRAVVVWWNIAEPRWNSWTMDFGSTGGAQGAAVLAANPTNDFVEPEIRFDAQGSGLALFKFGDSPQLWYARFE